MTGPVGAPTFLDEEEEVLGDPSFEMWVLDGKPMISGCYFMIPPLTAVRASWDAKRPDHLLVRASDGSDWEATDVPLSGSISVVLSPIGEASE
ncbi:hypothetical protein ACSMXN_06095 [Jatrophihabitans sp. DSM 45814]